MDYSTLDCPIEEISFRALMNPESDIDEGWILTLPNGIVIDTERGRLYDEENEVIEDLDDDAVEHWNSKVEEYLMSL